MIQLGQPSIRLLIAAIVVIPTALVAALLITITSIANRSSAEAFGEQIIDSANTSISRQVQSYLGEAMHVSDRYVRRIEAGLLPTDELAAWERPMLDDLLTTPDVASICFGNADGDATWLLWHGRQLELGRADGERNGHLKEDEDNTQAQYE